MDLTPPLLLHVEDDQSHSRLFALAVAEARLGASPLVACNAVEAFNLLVRSDRQHDLPLPSLIVVDLGLPAIEGRAILKTLKADARWQAIPVVVFSASALEREECLALGAAEYVVKPTAFDGYVEFARSLTKYLGTANAGAL